MHFISEQRSADGVLEREFALGEIPGTLWTPASEPSSPRPLILMGHPGGLARMHPRLAARARRAVADGFAAATIELPGGGGRSPIPALEAARAEMRESVTAGRPVSADVIERLVLPLADLAVPEWRAALDALLSQPDVDGPVGYSGGVIAIGVRLAALEPRIAAAGLFAGSFIPRATFDEAGSVRIPVHMLLQWDDEHNDRRAALDLFDALGSAEKTLQANLGGHTGVPAFAGEDAARFFARHLGGAPAAVPREPRE